MKREGDYIKHSPPTLLIYFTWCVYSLSLTHTYTRIPYLIHMQTLIFIAHARRECRMFILDATEVNTTMYANILKAESDIELWHNRVGHVNLDKL